MFFFGWEWTILKFGGECRERLFKGGSVSSADSVGSQLVCHWHTLTPRRAQNLPAGCIFVGTADKSAFALLSGK